MGWTNAKEEILDIMNLIVKSKKFLLELTSSHTMKL